ncbi:MAG: Ig-like domain-containing protein [Myxococcales bacterium]|nr:Ig-like domain-containing protein [Myxococcales bacterium]
MRTRSLKVLPWLTCAVTVSACAGSVTSPDGELAPEPAVEPPPSFSEEGQGEEPRGVYQVIEPQETYSAAELSMPAAPPRRIIFVNGQGGSYHSGYENSRTNSSGIIRYSSVTMPPFGKGAAAWSQLLTCVKSQFARFNVEVTDVNPGNVPHIEAVISGSPGHIGLGSGIGGIAPMNGNCATVENGITWIFERSFSSVRTICDITAQEVGHAIGLDHEYLCQDPMSYLGGCGGKSFQDKTVSCGEYSTRWCMCTNPLTGTAANQSSVQFMLKRLGPASANPSTPDAGTTQPPPNDPVAPAVVIQSPAGGATLPAYGPFSVTAMATDKLGVARMELYWRYLDSTIRCESPPGGVTCTRAGDTYTWTFEVGSGDRTFHVHAYDAAGNEGSTPNRTVHLTSTAQPPAPSIANLTPGDGSSISRGQLVKVSADVSGGGVSTVTLYWTSPIATLQYPMSDPDGDGRYEAKVQMSSNAVSGPRHLQITARNVWAKSTSATVDLNLP